MPTYAATLYMGAAAPDPADTLASRGFTNIRPAVPFTGAVKAFLDRLPVTPNVGQQFRIADTYAALQQLGVLPSDGNPGIAAQCLLSCGVDGSLLVDWAGHQDATNHGADASDGLLVSTTTDGSQWVDLDITLSTNARFSLHSAAFVFGFQDPGDSIALTLPILGRTGGIDTLRFLPRGNTGQTASRLNATTTLLTASASDPRGVWGVNRYLALPEDAASHLRITHGAAEIADVTSSIAAGLPTTPACLFRNTGSYTTGSINAMLFLSGMAPTLHDAVVAVVRAHLSGLGLSS